MSRHVRTFALMIMLSTAGAVIVRGQGGTGRETPKPSPNTTTPAKPPAGRNPTVVQIEGTTWQFEATEAGKPAGRNFFEFLPKGKLRVGGEEQAGTVWRQIGRRVVIDVADENGAAHFDGIISGSQMTGTMAGKDKDGARHEARLRAKRADAESLAELSFWKSIKDSTNPEDFKRYLERYPLGAFAGDAGVRIRLFENKSSPEPSPTKPGPTNSSGSTPPRPRPNQAGIEFVLIPPGSFIMGSTAGAGNEQPAHQVTINYPFYMGKYEVTQAQWELVMGNNPSSFKECGRNCPVGDVTWDDAQKFIQRLNGLKDGYTYRLPTEAEWEYACRAGTTGDYAGKLNEMGWYYENSGSRTHAVGEKESNGWGLADMHGNVWEWCQDWYHESYHGAPTDGSAWLIGGAEKYRVLRGGSYFAPATSLRSAVRLTRTSDDHNVSFGFRVVATQTQ